MKISRLAAQSAGICLAISAFTVSQAAMVLTIDDPTTSGIDIIVSDGQTAGFVTDSGLTTNRDDGGIADGAITFNGAVGSFTVNVVTGVSDPLISPGQLDLNSINVSGGVGDLVIGLTDTGYTGAVPAYTANLGGTTSGAVYFDFAYGAFNEEFPVPGWSSPGTGYYGRNWDTTVAFSDSGTFPTTGCFGFGCNYSLGIFANIWHLAAGQITSFDAHLAPVPLPVAFWLFGSGLLGLIGIARRKRTV
jgi:hypothetical protein